MRMGTYTAGVFVGALALVDEAVAAWVEELRAGSEAQRQAFLADPAGALIGRFGPEAWQRALALPITPEPAGS